MRSSECIGKTGRRAGEGGRSENHQNIVYVCMKLTKYKV